jgi:hypothetical protein
MMNLFSQHSIHITLNKEKETLYMNYLIFK